MNLKLILDNINQNRTGAEKALFDTSSDRLLAVALRYVYHEETARDVLQEGYIRIFKAIRTFQYQSESETWSWMNRIITREALRWIKLEKRNREKKSIPAFSNKDTYHIHHPLMEDEKFRLLQCLNESERIAFNMFAIEGFSHQEVAQELNIAESSSRSLVARARKKLQVQLQKIDHYEQRQRIS